MLSKKKKEPKPLETDYMKPKHDDRLTILIFAFALYLIVCLFACHLAIIAEDHPRVDFFDQFNLAFENMKQNPIAIFPLADGTIEYIFVCTLVFIFAAMCMWIEKERFHTDGLRIQGGSSHWLTESKNGLTRYNQQFSDPYMSKKHDGEHNMILTKDIFLNMDTKKTRLNNNILVVGGSGSGKSRFVIKPNVLMRNCSMVITDPSGEILESCGKSLEDAGFKIKVLNLVEMSKSNRYNPFNYIRNDEGVMTLVNCLIKNTTPPESNKGDPFWEKSETALLEALIFYLIKFCPEKCRNFTHVMSLLRSADINENDSSNSIQSPLDLMFEEAERKEPGNIACKQYKTFKMGAGRTLKSILISCAVRLSVFDLEAVERLTEVDDIGLDKIGDEKTALILVLPAADDTYNFIASMAESQLFERLYYHAENECPYSSSVVKANGDLIKFFNANVDTKDDARQQADDFIKTLKNCQIRQNEENGLYEICNSVGDVIDFRGTREDAEKEVASYATACVSQKGKNCLPIHVRFLMDEFANIGQIPNFTKMLATMRKYEISCTVVLQNLAQIKTLYKDDWGSIVGNCDSFLFLGGQEIDTLKYVNEELGKKTIRVRSSSTGKSGMNHSYTARDLMTIDEIRVMPKSDCILIMNALYPIYGKKYPLDSHPNYKLTSDYDIKNRYEFKKVIPEKTAVQVPFKDQFSSKVDKTQNVIDKAEVSLAEKFAKNQMDDGSPVISDPKELNEMNVKSTFGIKEDEDSSIFLESDDFRDIEITYPSETS